MIRPNMRSARALTLAVLTPACLAAPAASGADDWLAGVEEGITEAAEQIRDGGRESERAARDAEPLAERWGADLRTVRDSLRRRLRTARRPVAEGLDELVDRAERLGDVPVRYFDALPDDPGRANRELARGLDPTDPASPLRALTRNPVLDPYLPVDWLTPGRERGFVAVSPGTDADGRPVPIRYDRSPIVYLNGALTSREKAAQTGRRLADHLGAVVQVWHNETNGCVGDAAETLLNMADLHVGVPGDLRAALGEPRPITVIAHSQGAAQLHAILTDRQRRGLSNTHVACVLLGAPRRAATGLEVGKWTFVANADDPVPNLLGGARLTGNLRDHAIESYVPRITPAMLW